MFSANETSIVRWHQIIENIVCHRQMFLGRSQPAPNLTTEMLNKATKILQAHRPNDGGSLTFLDSEDPSLLIWSNEDFDILVIVHWDVMLPMEET